MAMQLIDSTSVHISHGSHTISLQEFMECIVPTFDASMWSACQSTYDNDYGHFPNHRRCMQLDVLFNVKCVDFTSFLNSHNLTPSKNGWTLLKYSPGDFFKPHTDRLGEFTAILFPQLPNDSFTGGDLIISNSVTISSNNLNSHRIVIFDTHAMHEVTPILTGVRYAFKTSLFKEIDIPTSKPRRFTNGRRD